MSACPLVVLACESLHVCTVCIWRCEHARFCVEGFYALYINFHSFIHYSFPCGVVSANNAGHRIVLSGDSLDQKCEDKKKNIYKYRSSTQQ